MLLTKVPIFPSSVCAPVPIGDERCGVDRTGGLLNREGFAGQRRLVDRQIRSLDEPHVRRHLVAGVELHDIPGHEVFRGDRTEAGITEDEGARCFESQQGRHRLARTPVRREAQPGVDDEHDGDRDGFDVVTNRQ
jgi:hypothetical protein